MDTNRGFARLFNGVLILLMLSYSSCGMERLVGMYCYECTKGTTKEHLCDDDDRLDYLKGQGYTCTSSGCGSWSGC